MPGLIGLAALSADVTATMPLNTPAVSTATTGTLPVGATHRLDATSGALARTLPSAATAGPGGIVVVKKTDATSNAVTVTASGSDTINVSGSTRTLTLPREAAHFRSDGVSDWTVVASDTPVTQLDARYNGTYARSAQIAFRPGRRWIFGGDSITNGSTASNFAASYTRQSLFMCGTLYASADSIEAGTAGETSANLLARIAAQIDTYGAQALHIQIGTNDAGQSVPLSTFSANIQGIVAIAKARGIPVTIGTVPPRSAGVTTTQIRQLIAAYNTWIRMWAPGQGIQVAEVYGALVDTTTGDMLSTYDSGDGVHPNTAGHALIARAVAIAMRAAMATTLPASLVLAAGTDVNLISNPLFVSAGTDPTGSFSGVATGTTPTRSMVADTTGFLPAGQWAQADLTAAATTSWGRDFTINGALWAVGDTLALLAHIQVEDVSGGWDAAVAAGTAKIDTSVINQSGVAIATSLDRCAGRVISPGIYCMGPLLVPLTVPVGTTSMTYRYKVDAPNGLHVKAKWGLLGVLNATTLGLSLGSSVMVNL